MLHHYTATLFLLLPGCCLGDVPLQPDSCPEKEDYDIFGATLVMSRSVWQEVQRSENEPDIIRRTMSHGGGFAHTRIAYMEDNFIHRLMQIHGCVNIAPLVRSKGISGFIMPQHSNASVMRGGLVPHDLAQHVDVAEKMFPGNISFCHSPAMG